MENVTAYDIAIIGGGFTIVGALIGSLVGYWLSRLTTDYNTFVAAKSKLRATFSPILGQIYLASKHGNHDRPCVESFVKERLLACASAIEEFRPHVSDDEKKSYQDAWEEYRKMANDFIESAVEDSMKQLELNGAIEESIHKILSFIK